MIKKAPRAPVAHEWSAVSRQPTALWHGLVLSVHRFWSDQFGGHFYIMGNSKHDRIAAKYPGIWKYEAVAYWAFSALGSQTTMSAMTTNELLPLAGELLVASSSIGASASGSTVAPTNAREVADDASVIYSVVDNAASGVTFPLELAGATLSAYVYDPLTEAVVPLLEGGQADAVVFESVELERAYWLAVSVADPLDGGAVPLHSSWFVRQGVQPDELDADLLTATATVGTGVGNPIERIIMPSITGRLTVEFYSATLGVIERLPDVAGGEVVEFTLPEWNCWYRIAAWQEDGTPVLSLWLRHQVE